MLTELGFDTLKERYFTQIANSCFTYPVLSFEPAFILDGEHGRLSISSGAGASSTSDYKSQTTYN